jgi:hypothetical protein
LNNDQRISLETIMKTPITFNRRNILVIAGTAGSAALMPTGFAQSST